MGDKAKTVHFMGIGGSGMSAIAQIAVAQGYEVSGCDQQTSTPYLDKVQDAKIKIQVGHDEKHLENIDILAVTPAVYFQNPTHPEFVHAKEKNIVITWQEFMGTYLHKDKYVICVAGTHGKSTTTTMAGLLLQNANLDPTVEVGATVNEWHNNVLVGKGKYFVSEADEYYHNFLHYHPDIVILNNIEMDHPEYFGTFDKILNAFVDFAKNIKPNGVLIYNGDDTGCLQLVDRVKEERPDIKLIHYILADFPAELKLGVPGNHNKSNALGVIKLADCLNIDLATVQKVLTNFTGIGRRIELLGEKNGIKVYDDYANHPTAFKASISAVKELNPNSKIWVVIEPHTYSRLRAVLDRLPESLKLADQVIITKIFASREKDPGDFTGTEIAAVCPGKYIPEFPDVIKHLKSNIQDPAVVLVMGSGDSYRLSRHILEAI